jgi:hypothetical protein
MIESHQISVEGLPEHLVRVVEALIESMRMAYAGKRRIHGGSIPVRKGKATGALTRDEFCASDWRSRRSTPTPRSMHASRKQANTSNRTGSEPGRKAAKSISRS